MKVEVKFGSKLLAVQLPDTPNVTLGDLRTAIAEITNVPPPLQKLMGKPNLKDDTKTLSELGVKDGTKLMLIGSTATEVLAANTGSQAKEEQRAKRIKSLGDVLWLLPAFGGFMADPYVGGKGRPLEGASAAEAMVVLDAVMSRINPVEGNASILQAVTGGGVSALTPSALAQIAHVMLPSLSLAHRRALSKAHMVLRKAAELTAMLASVQEASAVPEAISHVISAVRGCGEGDFVLIPSGWIGQQQHTIVYLILTRTSSASYSLIVVNRTASPYHPHQPTCDKIKTQACIRLDRIAEEKMHDEAFWLVVLSLWMRANDPENVSEYCREEVLYDCLLPWLAEGSGATPPPSASAEASLSAAFFPDLTAAVHNDPVVAMPNLSLCEEQQQRLKSLTEDAKFSTTARSESSAMKGLITALGFLVRSFVCKSDPLEPQDAVLTTLKQLKMALKYEFYLRAAEDLVSVAQRHIAHQEEQKASQQKAKRRSPADLVGLSGAAPTTAIATPFSSPTTGGQRKEAAPSIAQMKDAVNKVLAAGADPKQNSVTLQLLFDQLTTRDFIKTNSNHIVTDVATYFKGKYVLLYFSASWCGPCKKIAPLLRECYDQLVARLPPIPAPVGANNTRAGGGGGAAATQVPVECVLASSDKSLAEFDTYAASFPNFLRLTWPNQAVYDAFDIKAIPTLLVFSPAGSLMTAKGVQALMSDPEGAEFPNGDKWSGLSRMTETDLSMWEHASQTLAHAALKRFPPLSPDRRQPASGGSWALSDDLFAKVHCLLTSTMELVGTLPNHKNDGGERSRLGDEPPTPSGGDEAHPRDTLSDPLTQALTTPLSTVVRRTPAAVLSPASSGEDELSYPHASLLPSASKARYYGQAFKPVIPELGDIARFQRPTSMSTLIETLIDARTFVDALWSRAKSSSTSSRVAVQMHVIEFVSWLFTSVIAVPCPPPQATATTTTTARTDDDDMFSSSVFHQPFPESASVRNVSKIASGPSSPQDCQLIALKQIYHLQLSFCTAWQAVETPARSYDSERCLVAVSILLVYDALARNTQNAKDCFLLAFLLNDDGGCFLSTTMCKSNRTYEEISTRLELTKPHHACVRHAQLVYIRHQHLNLRRELFDLRQTDKLELRKYSHTVEFMRRFLENCGYEVFSRQGDQNAAAMAMNMNQSEMEKLMMWFCDPRAPVAREHPEFTMLRDVTLLTKFLGTMELRDAQLLRKKKELDEFATWRLSFEEDTPGRQMSAGWRTRPDPPRWECLMVRGRDMDIADIAVKGFGDRELNYGEGLVLQSPIDVGARISVDDPTEDDILHTTDLPTFGGTLTIEESEMLLSMLTTPYLRIPMVLNFFSSCDRHAYLLQEDLQKLLRATLFEPGMHVLREEEERRIAPSSGLNKNVSSVALPSEIPLRLTRQQKQEVQIAIIRGDSSKRDCSALLGTPCGLLLSEFCFSPSSVLRPLLQLVRTIGALGTCSVYSINASYALYLLSLCTDVLSYGQFAVEKQPSMVLREPSEVVLGLDTLQSALVDVIVGGWMPQWFAEAEENDDTPTLCVLESYHASFVKVKLARLTWAHRQSGGGTALGPLSTRQLLAQADVHDSLVALLGSCAYVRARHGFGMGMQRTQLAAQTNDALLSPEEKLLRFLQAQGLDTSRVTKDMLEHGRRLMQSGGRRRAVFVQVRSRFYNDTVRVPNLFRADAGSGTSDAKRLKLPPLDVPEHLIFAILLEEHGNLSALLHGTMTDGLSTSAGGPAAAPARAVELDRIMNKVVHRVLREKKSLNTDDGGNKITRDDAWQVSGSAAVSTNPEAAANPRALVFSAPASGLAFHVQTCELFWRNDELKPVPDSMSHYTDYETILGKDVLQCGLVRRTLHRHWVHVVGTPYDIVEWDTTDPDDQGVHQPRILIGPPTAEYVEHVTYDGLSFDRPIDVDDEAPWPVKSERWAIDLVKRVLKEAFPMPQEMKYRPLALSVADCASSSSPFRLIMNDKPQYEKEEERNTWKEMILYKDPRQLLVFNLVPHTRGTYRSLVFCTDQRLALHSMALIRRPRDASTLALLRYQAGELKRRVQNEGSLEVWRFNAQIRGREVFTPARLLQGVVPSALLESFLFWHGEDDVIRGYPMSEEDDPADSSSSSAASTTAAAAASRQATLQHWFRYALEIRFTKSSRGVVSSGYGGSGGDRRCVMSRRNDLTYTSAAVVQAEPDGALARTEGVVDAASGMRRSVSFDERGGMGSPTTSTTRSAFTGDEEAQRTAHPAPTPDEASVAMLRSIYPSIPPHVLTYALRCSVMNISDAIEWIASPENESTITGLIQQAEHHQKCGGSPMTRRVSGGGSPLSGSGRSRSRTIEFGDGGADVLAAEEDEVDVDGVSPIRQRSVQPSAPAAPAVAVAETVDAPSAPNAHRQSSSLVPHSNPPHRGWVAAPPSEWVLLHLGDVSATHPLRPLLDALIRVEDASHILVWGRAEHNNAPPPTSSNEEDTHDADDADVFFKIHVVELPRLRAKFQPKAVSEGANTSTTRLMLLDHPGWMLSTDGDLTGGGGGDRRDAINRLAAPFPQHIVLRNVSEEFALFVPNHDFAKLSVRGNPFATELLFDRSSLQWQESVPSPFYLYHVHASSTFVVAPSLGASLYMSALCCMHRSYEVALRTLEACYVDTDFTVEEGFMCALMERTLDRSAPDLHPDAHAVRLKLAHAVMYSDNKLAFPLHVELESYLQKIRHVSSNCRLQREEVLDLLKRCGRAPPLVKTQLQLWVPFLQRHQPHQRDTAASSFSQEETLATQAPPPTLSLSSPISVSSHPHLLRMGQPWDKLLTMSFDSISQSTIRRIHYQPPKQPLVGAHAVKILWEDELLVDEESGANRQLGFFFLYQLRRGHIPVSISGTASSSDGTVEGKSNATSLAQILTRYFHLRHCRWGREAQEAGESESVPSFGMCVLGVMDAFPGAAWPDMTDRATLAAMARGTSTTAPTSDIDSSALGGANRERRTRLPEMIRGMERLMRTLYGTSMVRLQSCRRNLQRAHQQYQAATTMVTMRDHIIPRVLPSNTASCRVDVRTADYCHTRRGTKNEEASALAALQHLCTMPLNAAGLTGGGTGSAFVFTSSNASSNVPAPCPGTDDGVLRNTSSSLPFDVSSHPWASSHVSKDMLHRLGQDATKFAEMQRTAVSFSLASFDAGSVRVLMDGLVASAATAPPTHHRDAAEGMRRVVGQLVDVLMQLNRADEAAIQFHRGEMLSLANRSATADATQQHEKKYSAPKQQRNRLEQIRRDREPVGIEWLCGALLSTQMQSELDTINPYHGDVLALRSHSAWLMLCSNRRAFGMNALAAARALLVFTSQVMIPLWNVCCDRCTSTSTAEADRTEQQHVWFDQPDVLSNLRRHGVDWSSSQEGLQSPEDRCRVIAAAIRSRITTLVSALVDTLTAQRHHAEELVVAGGGGGGAYAMEPRFLLFEFLFSFLLRKRQVEMVRWFVANVRDRGISRVQQMLMGQGKTTVVGPLLALILADGEQLVTQVMPTALLEQSRTVLRRCFSTIVPKRILSLQFDRSTGDDANVAEALFQKLDSARRMRAVVVSAPECVKALFLKYVEELHVIETIGNNDLDATTSANHPEEAVGDDEESGEAQQLADTRRGREVRLLRTKTIARSNMADALVPILDLWRTGVMMMDEVDVLLHPLRSELNFPIGLKYPIDMSGARWNMPMHLLNAVFPTSTLMRKGEVRSIVSPTTAATSGHHNAGGTHHHHLLYGVVHVEATFSSQEITFIIDALSATHNAIQAALKHGLCVKALQREPHTVLLDVAYYRHELLPLLIRWLGLWLYGSIESERRYRYTLTRGERRQQHVDPHNGSNASPQPPLGQQFDAFLLLVSEFLTTTPRHLPTLKENIERLFSPKEMQLLFLARDWLSTVLPHVLSKIDRVGYGMLQGPMAPSSSSGGTSTPLSRRLMAIPFVAKDVPSRSSEFAHPDVVLGLTILAYRYEGLRLSDTKELLRQLKHDYSRQVGAAEQRPASRLYASWLQAAAAASGDDETSSSSGSGTTAMTSIPLSQLQVQDAAHLHSLHRTFRRLPVVLYYYLSHHVFPRTMNFQQLKISASGHELGSSLLFQNRIGFSGTPSNLLPLDLGECCYEPGSDGHMLSVLTNPDITSCELLPDAWNPLSLLRRIATANPPFHTLIDTGALITNMDNEQVARYLLEHLPHAQFEGVVFLDASDRQVVLLRSTELIVPVAQCGIPLSRRFTFFDQVHTTGMDIKQTPTATAVVTLGKDLVFRDYAQGSYRMRGIGKGQKIRVYVIPEVDARLRDVLGPQRLTGRLELDVPAWLILNAMRFEGLQFIKLCQQELLNIWRKRALQVLRSPPPPHPPSVYEQWVRNTSEFLRCRRFTALGLLPPATTPSDGGGASLTDHIRLMRGAIEVFREAIAFPVPDHIEVPVSFQRKIEAQLLSNHEALLDVPVHEPERSPPALAPTITQEAQQLNRNGGLAGRDDATARVTMVLGRMSSTTNASSDHEDGDPETAVGLSAEVVHEQEAEEEQEQEAEQEEQRVSHFSRDDEQHIPWNVAVLSDPTSVDPIRTRLAPSCNSPFFQCNGFQMRPDQPMLDVDANLFMSDNFFRAKWRGTGERRLKNCMLFAQWLVVGGGHHPQRDDDAAHLDAPPSSADGHQQRRFVSSLLSLAEGESLRWFMHHAREFNASVAVSLYMVNQTVASSTRHGVDAFPLQSQPTTTLTHAERASAAVDDDDRDIAAWMVPVPSLDATDLMRTVATPSGPHNNNNSAVREAATAVVFYRFMNNDMFYSAVELSLLRASLRNTPADVRLGVFLDSLRGRRRPNNEWQDTPIAEIFVENDAQHAALMARSALRRIEEGIRRLPLGKRQSIVSSFEKLLVPAAEGGRSSLLSHAHISVSAAIEALHAAMAMQNGGVHTRRSTSSAASATGLEEFSAAIRFALSSNQHRQGGSTPTTTTDVRSQNDDEEVRPSKDLLGLVGTFDEISMTYWAESVLPPLFVPTKTHRLWRCPVCRLRSVLPKSCAAGAESCHQCAHNVGAAAPPSESETANAEDTTQAEEEHWQCVVCTLINAPHCPVCIVCGSPSPNPPPPPKGKASHVGPWACSTCTLLNEPTAPMCGVCGSPNPIPPVTGGGAGPSDTLTVPWECPEGFWSCSVEQGGCSKYNPNAAFYCQVCDRARPNLASLRF